MSKAERQRLAALDKKMPELMSRFGSDKMRVEQTLEIMESLERYERNRRENLFAIVMPSGSGKTQLCGKYGFIDVDECCSLEEHKFLNVMRIDCLLNGTSWDNHNKLWIAKINQTLDLMDISSDTIIMVQDEILALAIGATPLIGLCPSDELFQNVYDQKVKDGNRPGAMLAALNRTQFLSASNIVMKNKRMYRSYEELDSLIIRTLLVNDLPCACPYKYSRRVKSTYYSEYCPEWVLVGDKSKCDPEYLLWLFEHNAVPKECLDYFFKDNKIPASFGFGVRMKEWAALFGTLRACIGDPKDFDIGGDMSEIFPYTYEKMKTRSNLNVQRLNKGTECFHDRSLYELATYHVGKPNSFVTGVLVYWMGIGSTLPNHKVMYQMLKVNYWHWEEVWKTFHSYIRLSRFFMCTEISELDRQKMMYLQLALGKEVEDADWKQEVADRTETDPFPQHLGYNQDLSMWTRKQYWTDFQRSVDIVHVNMSQRQDVNIQGFQDFYKLRASWLTKGSTVKNYLDPQIKKYTMDLVDEVHEVVGSIVARHNKKSLFEVYDAITMMDQPFELLNVTKMVTKLDECGHTRRALLPGGLLHYIIFCYVLYFPEKQGQVGYVRLNAPPDDDITYFETKMAAVPRLLFDWMNYNLYHSLDEMALVIEKLGDVVPAPADYKNFCMVIAESMYHMLFEDPEGGLHKFGRGLYSGWRGTTWINTVLNSCYVTAASMSFERLYGREPFRYLDGGGDDLDAGMNRHKDAYLMLSIMAKMNFQGKAIKQMIDTKSEFFRNTISIEGAFASPNRALFMFVNGKWEGSGNVPIKERIGAILDQIGKIVRRGMDPQFGNVMAVLCLSHWCRVQKDKEWLDLPSYVLHGELESGGFGIPDREGNVWVLEDKVPEPKLVGAVGDPPGTKATRDYLAVLCRELREYNIEVEDLHRKEIELAKASFDVYEEYDYSELLSFSTRILSKRPSVEPKYNKELYDLFCEFTLVWKDDKDIAKIARYQELIPYMHVSGRKISMEQFCELMGVEVNPAVFEFTADVYYRRLLSEPVAKAVTAFCEQMIARDIQSVEQAGETFRCLAWECYTRFEFHI
jgi:hypothetical protein